MLVTARAASRIFEDAAAMGRQQSRRVLLAGVAGQPVRAGQALMYDEDAVRACAAWQQLDHHELLAACVGPVLVVRLGRGLEPDPRASWEERVRMMRRQPSLGFAAWLQVRAFLAEHGRLACAMTVCGYPVLLADLVSFASTQDDQVELGLEPPGEWSVLLHERRLVTGAGPVWLLLGEQPYLGRAARAHERGEPVGAARSTTWARWA